MTKLNKTAVVLWSLLALVLGGFATVKDSESMVFLTSPDGFAISCRTGFTRTAPHYCLNIDTINVGAIAWSDASACTVRTLGGAIGLPTGITVDVQFNLYVLSNNAIALRENTVSLFNDATCSTSAIQQIWWAQREFAAVGAGSVLNRSIAYGKVRLSGVDQFSTTQSNNGGNGNGSVFNMNLVGYYD